MGNFVQLEIIATVQYDQHLLHLQNMTPSIPQKQHSANRCLFGVSDPKETEALLKDQIDQDCKKMKATYGFDVLDLENLENNLEPKIVTKKQKTETRTRFADKRTRRKALQPYNKQAFLTEFYKSVKSVNEDKRKQPLGQEN